MGSCEDAIAEVFSLGVCEKNALLLLCRRKAGVKELAHFCKKSPPRMAQALSRLAAIGLVKKEKVCLARGYKYMYFASSKKELAASARRALAQRRRKLLSLLS